jgi:NadR type nicotinamide-nucleotide adenylyltransferase
LPQWDGWNGNIRSKLPKHIELLDKLRKIAITGPESTGKSVLSAELAMYYGTIWVPEYARHYLEVNGPGYLEKDILAIARGQLEQETGAEANASGYLFCDTEFIVTKIWSDVKYGRCHPWILQQVKEHAYDLFLLCNIDLPWTFDPLREHPGMRKELFNLYCNELDSRGLPYAIVNGSGMDRLDNATRIINEYFNKK